MSDSASVTWIRVGPGKFVRADANSQAIDQAQTEEVTVDAHPATDAPAQESLASPAPADALVVEQGPSDPPETTSGDEARAVVSDNCVLGSVTEVYGIAPSAFGSIPPDSLSVEGLEHDASEVAVTPEADSSPMADLGGNTSSDDVDRGTARFTRKNIGESSVPGFARDRQRDPEWGSSVLAMQRPKRPETPDPDLVFLSTERAPPASSAPRLRTDSSCPTCAASSLTALLLEACLKSRLRWPGLFAESLARVPGQWNQPDDAL